MHIFLHVRVLHFLWDVCSVAKLGNKPQCSRFFPWENWEGKIGLGKKGKIGKKKLKHQLGEFPVYQGRHLSEEQIAEAMESIVEIAKEICLNEGKVVANLAEFQAKAGFWSKDFIWDSAKHTSPHAWWKGLCKTQVLSALATKLFSVPPTSAAAERIWSKFGKTHTITLNCLTNERVNKLVAIRSHLLLSKRNMVTSADTSYLEGSAEEDFSLLSESGESDSNQISEADEDPSQAPVDIIEI